MTKVVHIITRLILGGAQENTLLTCKGLIETGRYDVTLITGPAIGPEGELMEQARAWGVPLEIVPEMRREINPLRDYRSLLKIRKLLQAIKPDIVHTHSSKAGIIGRYAARKENTPLIVHTIHGLPFHRYEKWWKNALFANLERRCAEFSDAIVCVARAMTDEALKAGVGAENKFHTIYSGMELEPFLRRDYDTSSLKHKLGIAHDDIVVGKIARIAPLKGHEFLIRAMQNVLMHVPKAKLLLVGDGPSAGHIKRLAQEAGVQNRVAFAGLVPNSQIPLFISLMDVVVHCSLHEGLARVIPQAQLMGKPVIAYDIDGAGEAIDDGVTGCLIAPESVQELGRKIIELLMDRRKAGEIGRNAQQSAARRFGADIMVGKIDLLYKQLLARIDKTDENDMQEES